MSASSLWISFKVRTKQHFTVHFEILNMFIFYKVGLESVQPTPSTPIYIHPITALACVSGKLPARFPRPHSLVQFSPGPCSGRCWSGSCLGFLGCSVLRATCTAPPRSVVMGQLSTPVNISKALGWSWFMISRYLRLWPRPQSEPTVFMKNHGLVFAPGKTRFWKGHLAAVSAHFFGASL